jgi:excisionase family DNA binding protein
MTTTQLLSITRAAEVLDCSRGHIYGLIAAGKLRAVELKAKGTRSKTRIRAEDLEAFIEANTRVTGKGGDSSEARRIDGN